MAASEGAKRPAAFVEDTAVAPERLGDYVKPFRAILDRHGLTAGFYGHCSVGCLHIRPFVDLTAPGGVDTMAAVAGEIAALVAEFDGVNSSEHGDGRVRSPFNPRVFGDDLYAAFRKVKALFDPDNRFNPGVMVDAPPLTTNLRDPALPPAQPLQTHFSFGGGTMRDAADRCQRIGACRKTGAGVMCPSYMATREEEHATRGRANALVKALSRARPARRAGRRAAARDPRPLPRVQGVQERVPAQRRHGDDEVGVPLALPGAARHAAALEAVRLDPEAQPPRRRDRAAVTTSRSRAGCSSAWPGIDRRRPLPRFARETLLRWDKRRTPRRGAKGDVVFLADSFTTFTEPAIGRAAIELLEAAGWNVRLESAGCCGRSSISKGLLDQAQGMAEAMVGPARARGRARRPDRRLRAVVPADAARGAPGAARRRRPRGDGREADTARRGAAGRGDRRRLAAARPGRRGQQPPDRVPRPLPPEGAGRHGRHRGAARAHPRAPR